MRVPWYVLVPRYWCFSVKMEVKICSFFSPMFYSQLVTCTPHNRCRREMLAVKCYPALEQGFVFPKWRSTKAHIWAPDSVMRRGSWTLLVYMQLRRLQDHGWDQDWWTQKKVWKMGCRPLQLCMHFSSSEVYLLLKAILISWILQWGQVFQWHGSSGSFVKTISLLWECTSLIELSLGNICQGGKRERPLQSRQSVRGLGAHKGMWEQILQPWGLWPFWRGLISGLSQKSSGRSWVCPDVDWEHLGNLSLAGYENSSSCKLPNMCSS